MVITYEYTKICENIWQIEEDNSVCCTLVIGSKMAVLIDTGYALKQEWDVIKHFEENEPKGYELKEIQIGQNISLGSLNIEVVSLVGHTKGSVGFIVQEEKILIAGDALNERLWLFNYGSLTMSDLYEMIKITMDLDFTTYLCGHSIRKYKKEKLMDKVKQVREAFLIMAKVM